MYYIGKIDKQCELVINKENKDQYTEIKDIKWCSEDECLEKIRNYDNNKTKVVVNFFEYLRNHEFVVTME